MQAEPSLRPNSSRTAPSASATPTPQARTAPPDRRRRPRNQREKADGLLQGVKDMQTKVESMHYRQRGVVVPTPYGHCQVLLFRENDEMVIVQLPFGKPRARMYSTSSRYQPHDGAVG